eukprot:7627781-Pyramimonas_sp.AAC.1
MFRSGELPEAYRNGRRRLHKCVLRGAASPQPLATRRRRCLAQPSPPGHAGGHASAAPPPMEKSRANEKTA